VIARRGALAASLALLLASAGAAEAAGVRLLFPTDRPVIDRTDERFDVPAVRAVSR
jgi:hypothetical protein